MSLTARLVNVDGALELRSPGVGLWRDAPVRGAWIGPGAVIGRLEVLGALETIVAPDGARGVVIAVGGDRQRARRPVGYDELLLRIDPALAGVAEAAASLPGASEAANVFRAASSGRFYSRPAPDRPPFVEAGDPLSDGQPIALLEVMKTFSRIHYSGPPARVARIVPRDGDDLEAGDVILELEPAP